MMEAKAQVVVCHGNYDLETDPQNQKGFFYYLLGPPKPTSTNCG
jgi:hypothetical protein